MPKIRRSSRKGKDFLVKVGDEIINFGDSSMPEFPGTKRGDRYCARSSGQKGANNPRMASFWSRKVWGCAGKKSFKSRAKRLGDVVRLK